MSDYTKVFNKSTGDTIAAADFNTEFASIETAIATKLDVDSDTATNLTIGSGYAGSVITSETVTDTTSGTTHDYTSIPSWVKKITIMLSGVSTGSGLGLMLQLGDSGGIESTGYVAFNYSKRTDLGGETADTSVTSGFLITNDAEQDASSVVSGKAEITLLDSSTNTWIYSGVFIDNDSTATQKEIAINCGTKSLSATLDRVRLTTTSGGTFDAGKFNILYEG